MFYGIIKERNDYKLETTNNKNIKGSKNKWKKN